MSRYHPKLREILESKRAQIEVSKRLNPDLRDRMADRGATLSLRAALSGGDTTPIIAELKRASPSAVLRANDFDPVAIAREYESAGAAAISVLTDTRFFWGEPTYLAQIKEVCSIPVLRKDFIISSWQLYESFMLGADAVLLMPILLERFDRLAELYEIATGLGMETIVEIGDEADLEMAARLDAPIVGVNNRDFRSDDFAVDLTRSERLGAAIGPERIKVSESGIASADDIARLKRAGYDAFLVGSTLMKQADPAKALAVLLDSS